MLFIVQSSDDQLRKAVMFVLKLGHAVRIDHVAASASLRRTHGIVECCSMAVRLQVFRRMDAAQQQIQILDWGVANATLEEVFIKFAQSIGAEGGS